MPRERRIEYAGAIYHVMARGNRRGDIVLDDQDRRRFEETLAEVVEASGWVLYGWVLMNNHQWSSLPDYVKVPSKRRPWVAVARP